MYDALLLVLPIGDRIFQWNFMYKIQNRTIDRVLTDHGTCEIKGCTKYRWSAFVVVVIVIVVAVAVEIDACLTRILIIIINSIICWWWRNRHILWKEWTIIVIVCIVSVRSSSSRRTHNYFLIFFSTFTSFCYKWRCSSCWRRRCCWRRYTQEICKRLYHGTKWLVTIIWLAMILFVVVFFVDVIDSSSCWLSDDSCLVHLSSHSVVVVLKQEEALEVFEFGCSSNFFLREDESLWNYRSSMLSVSKHSILDLVFPEPAT